MPRIFTPPLRKLTPKTTLGFECIDFAEKMLELDLMPWQKWFLLHALELHPTEVDEYDDPVFRFRKVVLLVGRQNGKSTVMQALTLWRMFVDRCSLVIGTAQDLEVAEALWAESLDMALDVEDLRDEIDGGKIERQPGRKMFRLRTRETYKVKAASRRGGRGLSGELVLLDELREHQSWDAWAAVTKTTNAKSRAQIYGISNAGDASSIVLRYLRKTAHAELGDPDGICEDTPGVDDDLTVELDEDVDLDSGLGIFEWSAPPGCDLDDRDGWAQANPSLGHRIRETTLASDSRTDPEWVFRTEVLCQWSDGTIEGPFPPGTWEATTDPASQITSDRIVACVDVAHDRSRATIAFAGWRDDGVPHVEVVAARAGVEWVQPWLTERVDNGTVQSVTGQTRGAPVSGLMKTLAEADLPVVEWGGTDLGGGTGAFYDAVRDGRVRHLPQPVLDVAAAVAATRPLGDAWVWDRKKSPADISPLVAATGALWLLTRPEEKPFVSAYETSRLEVL